MRETKRSKLNIGDRFKFAADDTNEYNIVAVYPNGQKYYKRPGNSSWGLLAQGPAVFVVGGAR